MKRLARIEDLHDLEGPLHMAIGVFDGVHRGHQAVLDRPLANAQSDGGWPVMVTFDPHPIRILRPDQAPRILTHTDHKLQLAHQLGMRAALVISFDEAFARIAAEQFIREMASSARDLQSISVGEDWRFGAGRAGDLDLLMRLGAELGFQAHGIPPFAADGEPISSTRIRASIQAGEFDAAEALLGRPYSVLGEVIQGRQLGRTIGVPTANLAVFEEQLPPGGVYSVEARHGADSFLAVANLGLRPTVESAAGQRLLEVHLLDYDGGDFYGEHLEVTFREFPREEQSFDSLDALKVQIQADIEHARQLLPHHS